MIFGVITDPHAGNHQGSNGGAYVIGMNARCRAVVDTISRAAQTARAQGCTVLVICGDLFDDEKPTPQMIAAVAEAFNAGPEFRVFVLLGNHDRVSGVPGDNAVGWVRYLAHARVFEKPEALFVSASDQFVIVPFQDGPSSEWLPEVLAGLAIDKRAARTVLFVHMGIRDDVARLNPWAAAAEDAIDVELLGQLCVEHGITHVFAGNWHHQQSWAFSPRTSATPSTALIPRGSEVAIVQVGTLAPTGWDNPGLVGYGGLAIYNDGAVSIQEIPGPRFVDVKSRAELDALLFNHEEQRLHVRWKCAAGDGAEATRLLTEAQKSGEICQWRVDEDFKEIRASAQAGARVATSARTLHEALDSYIQQLTLPANVTQTRVHALTSDFLALSSEVIDEDS